MNRATKSQLRRALVARLIRADRRLARLWCRMARWYYRHEGRTA